MIIVYPLIISSSVSKNAIPGICKVLERFVIVYRIDSLLKYLSVKLPDIKISPFTIRREDLEYNLDESSRQTPPGMPTGATKTKNQPQTTPNQDKKDEDKRPPKNTANVKIDQPNANTIAVEPTWIKLDGANGSVIVGVKVVPYQVRSDEELVSMLVKDRESLWLRSHIEMLKRGTIRILYSAARMFRVPFVDQIVSGDPVKDIIYAGTQHKDNVFCCFNMSDLGEEDYFSSASGVSELYKMGWSSFIISDDVNRRATFCMKEFKGMCTMLPYSMLYTSLGKEYAKVYDGLEDIKKTSSPFFSLNKRASKIFGESISNLKLNKMRDLINGRESD